MIKKLIVKYIGLKKKQHITIFFIHPYFSTSNRDEEKSRRDGIILTVDFNLRTGNAVETWRAASLQSPEGRTLWRDKVSSLRDLLRRWLFSFRRLKPTVNQVLSLRDFLLFITDFTPIFCCYNFVYLHIKQQNSMFL